MSNPQKININNPLQTVFSELVSAISVLTGDCANGGEDNPPDEWKPIPHAKEHIQQALSAAHMLDKQGRDNKAAITRIKIILAGLNK